jgi:hypothetical protein
MTLTTVNPALLDTQAQYTGFKNRIINGAMVIDQRNAGAEVNPAASGVYYLDRWIVQSSQNSKFKIGQSAGAVTPPAGFTKYLGCTSLSAYSVVAADAFNVGQRLEGLNVSDLAWGTASATAVTLSFWVYSSLTGTFGGAVQNNASDRSYPFSYTVSAANTWEQKTVTIAGDTTGIWLTDNGVGIRLFFSLGTGATQSGTAGAWSSGNYRSATGATSVVGTSGATFYITGVQLEKGSTATAFDYRPYGTELALCQRYYYRMAGAAYPFCTASVETASNVDGIIAFPISMRAAPSSLEQSGTFSHYTIRTRNTDNTCSAVPSYQMANLNSAWVRFTGTGLTVGSGALVYSNNAAAYLAWSAEL